jgi:hypothetical protein
MVCGILLQVPNAIAAAGGLSADSDTDNPQGINTAVLVSIRMIQVGIGLAIRERRKIHLQLLVCQQTTRLKKKRKEKIENRN